MSHNLRYPAADAHPWSMRRAAAHALINQELPHLIATQEGVRSQLEEFIGGLDERYAWTGEAREGGDEGEFAAVVYDRHRLRLQDTRSLWLSETPDHPSRSWGSAYPRVTTLVDLTDAVTGRPVRFISTHLDHRSASARLESAELLRDWASQAAGACLLAGDFNEDAGGPVHRRLMQGSLLADAFEGSAQRVGREIGTFHGYRGARPGGKRIDWILHSRELTAIAAGINEFTFDGRCPSDHWPVQAILDYRARPRLGREAV